MSVAAHAFLYSSQVRQTGIMPCQLPTEMCICTKLLKDVCYTIETGVLLSVTSSTVPIPPPEVQPEDGVPMPCRVAGHTARDGRSLQRQIG
jgi:hypothetical protein